MLMEFLQQKMIRFPMADIGLLVRIEDIALEPDAWSCEGIITRNHDERNFSIPKFNQSPLSLWFQAIFKDFESIKNYILF